MHGTMKIKKKRTVLLCAHTSLSVPVGVSLKHFTLKDEAQTALFKDPVRTALKTLSISVIKTNQFML